MKKTIALLAVLATITAFADKGVLYEKATGNIVEWVSADAGFKGLNPALAFGVSTTAKGDEKNISAIADLAPVKTEAEVLADTLKVLVDDTKSKAEKQAAIDALPAKLENVKK